MKSLFAGMEREAWLRFLLALVGLGLAFASALFSTLARESGNLPATALFASAALLLAGLVGVTTVPYLARRVAVRRVREAFDYDVTREGIAYLAALLLIGAAALNTGNNLLFIVLAAMLAAILISGLASAVMLRGLALDVSMPAHVFAGSRVLARVTVRSSRRWLPAFSISVVPPKDSRAGIRWSWRRSHFGFPFGKPPERQWLRVPDLAIVRTRSLPPRSAIFTGAVYFPYLKAGDASAADVELCFERRGRYQQDALGLATRFPFAFLEKTRRVRLDQELIVYPRVEPPEEFFEVLPIIRGEFEAFLRGRGHDLYRIREYAPEDSARHVDWKATARSLSLKVREYTREDERKLRIVFDNPTPEAAPPEVYENGVVIAASLAWHFAGEDTQLSFAGPGYAGSPDVYDFLRYLALIAPAAAPSVLESMPMSDDYNIIITSRVRGTIPTPLWACSYFVFLK